ncbi:MAG: ABC transporter ATP-binding protein [Acetobacteraceae bacterium]
MATLSLRQLRKSYGPLEVVHGIDLEVADGEFVVLVGPSGCGKSTILRMIAGLEEVSDGEIRIADAVVNQREPKDRDIAMVFQDYALYPHLTVFRNIAIALEYRGVAKPEIQRRVTATAKVLEISELLERLPRQLSGGQRQRVAMGRAIVRDPKVFLFDEPLSNLDAKLRVQMRSEIRRLRARVPATAIYVTHDQVEAMTLADRIVILNQGRVEQIGAPDEVYERPITTFVAGFLGAPPMNLLPARLETRSGAAIAVIGEEISLPITAPNAGTATEIWCGVRPEDLQWTGDAAPAGRFLLTGTALTIEPLGPESLVTIALAGQEIACRAPPKSVRRAGEEVRLAVDPERLHLFDRATGCRI